MIDRRQLQEDARADGHFSLDFGVLTLGAAAIATFGLLENSTAVIIGAMIVAPLIRPIEALAVAALDARPVALRSAAGTLASGIALAVLFAAVLARIVSFPSLGTQVMARSQPDLLDLGIALAAGGIAAFARVRPSIAGAVAGTAIAVALMPPLCVIGIGIARADWTLARGAFLLFLTNLFGIMLASMAVFVWLGYARLRRAGRGLTWTALALAAIAVPLALSTGQLIRQARLESQLRSALVNGTVTFHRAELLGTSVDWVTSPPTARLLVRSAQPITPTQVRLLEAFAEQHTGTDFHLVLDVTPVSRVDDGG